MTASKCDGCGEVAKDIDVGFSPGVLGMRHDCGGSWRVMSESDAAPIAATIHERGNGLPDVGDHVPGDDGSLYRVVSFVGPIHTGGPGAGNYVHATVELADWDDVSEEEEFPALAVVSE